MVEENRSMTSQYAEFVRKTFLVVAYAMLAVAIAFAVTAKIKSSNFDYETDFDRIYNAPAPYDETWLIQAMYGIAARIGFGSVIFFLISMLFPKRRRRSS
jgi:hypothetical protein